MKPESLIFLERTGRSVTCKPGTQHPELGIWPGRHRPASWVLHLSFKSVMRALPDLIRYVKKEDRKEPDDEDTSLGLCSSGPLAPELPRPVEMSPEGPVYNRDEVVDHAAALADGGPTDVLSERKSHV